MKEFEGKYCIVTGAARGMGRQVAEKLAAQGAKLALMDINAELLGKTASEIAEAFDTQVISVPCDLSNQCSCVLCRYRDIPLDHRHSRRGMGSRDECEFEICIHAGVCVRP